MNEEVTWFNIARGPNLTTTVCFPLKLLHEGIIVIIFTNSPSLLISSLPSLESLPKLSRILISFSTRSTLSTLLTENDFLEDEL